jgi:hypothetical protein
MRNKKKNGKLRYGSRKANKLVRCYHKDELGVFRVEVELHSSLLRRNNISTLDDFICLPEIIFPKHLKFVDLDWGRLKRYLARNIGDEGNQVNAGAGRRAGSLQRLRRYLNRKGVVNVHRFLVPLAINDDVARALKRWIHQFERNPTLQKRKLQL